MGWFKLLKDVFSLLAKLPDLIEFLTKNAKERDAKAKESEAAKRRDEKVSSWDAAVDSANAPVLPLGGVRDDSASASEQSGTTQSSSTISGGGESGTGLREGGGQDNRGP